MKTFKLSLVLHNRENTDVFITLGDNIYGINSKRVNILYLSVSWPPYLFINIIILFNINFYLSLLTVWGMPISISYEHLSYVFLLTVIFNLLTIMLCLLNIIIYVW